MNRLFKRIALLSLIALIAATMLFAVSCDSDDTTTTTTAAPGNGNQPSKEETPTGGNNEQTTTTGGGSNTQTPAQNPTYTVTVVDQNGAPIKDAKIQLCKADVCDARMYTTNEQGIATFQKPENSEYKARVLSAPGLEIDSMPDSTDPNAQYVYFGTAKSITITLTYPEVAE